MEILHNDQRLKPFLWQFKISSFSVFVQTTSRLCVCFEADLIVMAKTGHLLRYLPGNCTLRTILIFMLCDTIPCYTMLSYTILYLTTLYYTMYYTHTICSAVIILYYTILYYTILYYTVLYCTALYCAILYYTHLHSLLGRQQISDTEASFDRHPSSSVAWVLQSSMLTNQKHSYLFFVLQQSSREFESSCVLNVWKNVTLDVLASDIQLVCFCASSQIDYRTELVIKVWPYNTDLLPWERAKWISSRKLHLNPTVECTSWKAGLYTLKWCIWVDVASLWGE